MHENRIRNVLLAAVVGLLILNIWVTFSVPAYALGKTQYKAVAGMTSLNDEREAQRILDQMSSQGWEYVGSISLVLVFKK